MTKSPTILSVVAALLSTAGLRGSTGQTSLRGHFGTLPRLRRQRQKFKAKPFIGKIKNIRGTLVFHPRHASSTPRTA